MIKRDISLLQRVLIHPEDKTLYESNNKDLKYIKQKYKISKYIKTCKVKGEIDKYSYSGILEHTFLSI